VPGLGAGNEAIKAKRVLPSHLLLVAGAERADVCQQKADLKPILMSFNTLEKRSPADNQPGFSNGGGGGDLIALLKVCYYLFYSLIILYFTHSVTHQQN